MFKIQSTRIRLSNGKYTIVDREIADEIRRFKWYYDKGYAVRSSYYQGKKTKIYLNRLIMELAGYNTKDKLVDHKNRNRLDNRLINLRLVSAKSNSQNRKTKNKSGYKGVSYIPSRDRFRAKLRIDGKWIIVGEYNNKQAAAKAYDDAAINAYGSFAYLNFPNRHS